MRWISLKSVFVRLFSTSAPLLHMRASHSFIILLILRLTVIQACLPITTPSPPQLSSRRFDFIPLGVSLEIFLPLVVLHVVL